MRLRARGWANTRMDFLKKSPFPLAAYCYAAYSVLRLFYTNGVVNILGLLAYIALAVLLFIKRRDFYLAIAAAAPCVVTLLHMLIYGTSLMGVISFLIALTVPAFVACFLVPQVEPYVGKYMDLLKKYWFVPAGAQLAFFILSMMVTLVDCLSGFGFEFGLEVFYGTYGFFQLLMNILAIGGNALLCMWMVYPEGIPEEFLAAKPVRSAGVDSKCGKQSGVMYYNPATGRYETATDAESVYAAPAAAPEAEPAYSAPAAEPVYTAPEAPADPPAVTYRHSAYLEDGNTDLKEKETFGKVPAQIAPPAQEQPAAPVYRAPVQEGPAKEAEIVQPGEDDVVEQLKKYKSLMDSGIITQEEFSAKKRQLLGL